MRHFGFALDLSDIDLWNIDLLDTHLDLLDTDITSKNFVCLRDVLKTSSRYVLKTSSTHVFKTSSRHLQRNNCSSSKTSWRRLEDVLKTSCERSWKRLEDVFEDVKLLCWRRVEDVFKTYLHMKTKILADFQICTGVPLRSSHPEVLYQKMFLEILSDSQKNIFAGSSFLIRLQAGN